VISGSLAKRYAKALFSLAAEEGNVDEVAGALEQLATGIAEIDAEWFAPGVLEQDTVRRLGEALASPLGRDTTLGRFVRLLSVRERLALLPEIRAWFVRMEDQAAGRARLAVSSARQLDEAEVRDVCAAFARLADREVIPQTSVDPELIGGIVVELEGRVYDGSVKTHLARLAARMAGE